MKTAPTLDRIIAFLKVHLFFACCWPLPRTATKFQTICDRIFRYLSMMNSALIIVELIYTISNHLDDILLIIQLAGGLGIICEVPLQIYLFTQQHNRLQNVICEMEDYCKQANAEKKNIFQQYINKYIMHYKITLAMVTLSFTSALIVPLIQSRKFPIEIVYPFNVDYQPMRAIIYFHQVFGIYQIYCQVCSNVFLALLIWFTTARFEIVINKFRTVTKYSDLKICIQEHQKTLRYANEMSISIAYIILSSLGISTAAVVFGGIIFLSQFPVSIKVEYVSIAFTSLIKVFLCAWPADHLTRTNSNVAEAAYNSLWYNQNIESQKAMLYTLLRCQQTVVISVPGLLKALTFQHYASYISTAFSFLTTFRTILSKET